MTTIAALKGEMSCDGREVADGMITGSNFIKIHKLSDGRLVGFSGQSYDEPPILEWLEDETKKAPKVKDCEVVVMQLDGSALWYDDKLIGIETEFPLAIGSGREFALTAMDMGSDTATAVKMAAKRDINTGGTIRTFRIGE